MSDLAQSILTLLESLRVEVVLSRLRFGCPLSILVFCFYYVNIWIVGSNVYFIYLWNSRVILPLTVDEYQIAQLYAVAKASKEQTGGGDGVEVLQNCPFNDKIFPPKSPLLDGFKSGQYTHKIYHVASKLPSFVTALLPASLMTFNELAWNAYPYCRTILTVSVHVFSIGRPLQNDFFDQKLEIKIESLHSTDITLENVTLNSLIICHLDSLGT